ncbi:putative signal peptide protein [Puccinia sorghi]|uniref:Putative signal peptide protein n=1 Tax=Puccinia sorghi TaxID=27349 RepID=A0A0L6US56_9BASI|nr:putative signal peptide protein [Puccinia sorghi]
MLSTLLFSIYSCNQLVAIKVSIDIQKFPGSFCCYYNHYVWSILICNSRNSVQDGKDLHTMRGCSFYLADAMYTLAHGVLEPYCGVQYHLREKPASNQQILHNFSINNGNVEIDDFFNLGASNVPNWGEEIINGQSTKGASTEAIQLSGRDKQLLKN